MSRSRKLAVIHPPPDPRLDALAEYGSEIRWRARSVARHVIEIGKLLTGAKGLCKHGEWVVWLREELGWQPRTAQLYMRVHEAFKNETVSLLKIDASALFLLSSSKTSAEVRAEAIRRAQEQERITRAKVRQMMKKPKPPPPTPEEYDAELRELAADELDFYVFEQIDEAHRSILDHLCDVSGHYECFIPEDDLTGLDLQFGDGDVQDARVAIKILVATLRNAPSDRFEHVLQRVTASCERASQILTLMRILRERLESGGSNGKVRSITA